MSKKFINWSYGISALLVVTGAILKINHFQWSMSIMTITLAIESIILSIYINKLEKNVENLKKEGNK